MQERIEAMQYGMTYLMGPVGTVMARAVQAVAIRSRLRMILSESRLATASGTFQNATWNQF